MPQDKRLWSWLIAERGLVTYLGEPCLEKKDRNGKIILTKYNLGVVRSL